MTLVELQTFLAIMDTGSLVRASEALNVTQSTVTARLKSLEDEVGQTLIRRNKSGAALTAAGERLLRYADTISNLWQQARQEVSLPNGLRSVCNIAAEPGMVAGPVRRFMERIDQDHPDVGVSLWSGSRADVAGWLSSGKADLAFTYSSTVSSRQSQIELAPENLILVSTAPDGPMRFDPGYVFVEMGTECGRLHAMAYADAATARISFGDPHLGRDHILRHGGSAYLPGDMVEEDILAHDLFQIANAPTFHRRRYLTINEDAKSAWPWFDECVAGELTGTPV